MKFAAGYLCILVSCVTKPLYASNLEFNGFASVVFGQTLGSDEQLYDFKNSLNFKTESRFGLQAQADLGEGLVATAQLVARGSQNFEAKFEWAYLSYKSQDFANNTWSIGRIRIPFYLQSEYLETGYAYHWLRTPKNVYNSSFNSWDGASWTNKHKLDMGVGYFQLQVGRLNDDNIMVRPGEKIEIDLSGMMAEYKLQSKHWQARLGYLTTDITVESELNTFFIAAIAGVEQSGADVPKQFIDNFLLEKDRLDFYSASLFYDNSQYFVGAEVTRSRYRDLSINPDNDHFYLTLGTSVDELTYHLTYGETDNARRQYQELVNGLNLAPELDTTLQAVTEGFTNTGPLSGERSKFYTLGVNYQFHYAGILKIELTHYRSQLDETRDAELLSVGIDVVF